MTQDEKTSLYAKITALCANRPYDMILRNKFEIDFIVSLISKGIDSYLEACFVPERGDKYILTAGALSCVISPESLCCLVRRIIESDNEEMQDLAEGIMESLAQ